MLAIVSGQFGGYMGASKCYTTASPPLSTHVHGRHMCTVCVCECAFWRVNTLPLYGFSGKGMKGHIWQSSPVQSIKETPMLARLQYEDARALFLIGVLDRFEEAPVH